MAKRPDGRKTAQAERGEKLPKGIVRLDAGGFRANRLANGKRQFARRATIAQCLDWLHDGQTSGVTATKASAKDLTFGQWADQWVRVVAVEPKRHSTVSRSLTTLRSYEVRLQVYKGLRSDPLGKLDAARIQTIEVASGLAGSSLHQSRIILNACLLRAVKDKLIPTNPLDDAGSIAANPKYQTKSLNGDERRRLYSAATVHRHGALLTTILVSGARQGEIRGLHWQDVRLNSDHASIDIRYTAQHVRGQGTVIKAGGKTKASERYNISLDVNTTAALRALHSQQGHPTSGPVFPSPTHGQFDCAACGQRHSKVVNAGTVEAAFRELTLQTGLRLPGQRLGSHIAGRHSLANLEAFRHDPAAAAKFLGHDVRTYLATYAHPDNKDNQTAATIGDALFATLPASTDGDLVP
jgi:integrase